MILNKLRKLVGLRIKKKKWIFRLERDYWFQLPVDMGNYREYMHKGVVWFTTENFYGCIKAGYAWDGCTPKWTIRGKLFGTPDGPIISHTLLDLKQTSSELVFTGRMEKGELRKFASLEHDVQLQFLKQLPSQLTEWMIHRSFKQHLERVGDDAAKLYHFGVSAWGKFKRIFGK